MSISKRVIPTLVVLAFAAAGCSSGGSDDPQVVVGASALSAGFDGTCAIGSSGGLACWGALPMGSPGDTTTAGPDALGATQVATPIDLIGVSLARGLNPGTGCVVGTDHGAYCWGAINASDIGQSIGNGIQALAGFTSLNSIAVGEYTLCGTRTDNGVRCGGWWTGGGRGTDSLTTPNDFDLTPNALKPALTAYGTALGSQFGCALRTDSLVACWGARSHGRLAGAAGDTLQDCGDQADPWCQPGPAPIAGGTKYRQLAANRETACAARISGEIDCWGRRLGVEATGSSGLNCVPVDACYYVATSMEVPGIATRVAVGTTHACALVSTGDVYCWGDNDQGQLGRPGAGSATPVKVSGNFTFSFLSVGAFHACAIEAGSGAVGCWGANQFGQLGDGTTEDRDHPVAVVAAE